MVMPQHLTEFFPDLQDPRLEASVVVFHQRFSTNTLPQWRLAHPFRYLAHNGEINTIEGNRNWAVARGPVFQLAAAAGPRRTSCRSCRCTGSDSQSLDNMLEVLLMGGLDPMQAMRLLDAAGVAERRCASTRTCARSTSTTRTHMEPWDGPAGIVLTDGRYAALHARPQRPAAGALRHHEEPPPHRSPRKSGVWDYAPEDVVRKGSSGPGEMIALDLQTGTLLEIDATSTTC